MTVTRGSRLGPYEIVEPIGAGGMGEVYRAVDTRLNRTVAIKVLPGDVSGDSERRERFEREAQAIGALNHPHICTLYDVGTFDGVLCLVMEHLDGETLADRLESSKERPLPVNEALRIGMQIADALDRAHRAGIVHRDVKPANVFLVRRAGPSGPSTAKLLDFGLAKAAAPQVAANVSFAPTTPAALTAQGVIVGTFQYMAPEQIEGGEADARSDIFSFGRRTASGSPTRHPGRVSPGRYFAKRRMAAASNRRSGPLPNIRTSKTGRAMAAPSSSASMPARRTTTSGRFRSTMRPRHVP